MDSGHSRTNLTTRLPCSPIELSSSVCATIDCSFLLHTHERKLMIFDGKRAKTLCDGGSKVRNSFLFPRIQLPSWTLSTLDLQPIPPQRLYDAIFAYSSTRDHFFEHGLIPIFLLAHLLSEKTHSERGNENFVEANLEFWLCPAFNRSPSTRAWLNFRFGTTSFTLNENKLAKKILCRRVLK